MLTSLSRDSLIMSRPFYFRYEFVPSHPFLHGGNDSHKRQEKRLIFKIGTIHPQGLNERFSFI